MKHIDIKSYLEAATASEEAWNQATDKLVEFENKLKELTAIKAQIKVLLDNSSMGSSHLRSLLLDLERYYGCYCGNLKDHPSHASNGAFLNENAHHYTNAFRSENE